MLKNKYLILLIMPFLFFSFRSSKIQANNSTAMKFFLQLEGIEGEVTQNGYSKWIEVEFYKFGANNSRNAAGNSSSLGVVNASDLTVNLSVADSSLTNLFEASLKSTIIPTGKLIVLNGANKHEEIEFKNLLVREVNINGNGISTGEVNINIKLNFRSIKRTIYQSDALGAATFEVMVWNYGLKTAVFNEL